MSYQLYRNTTLGNTLQESLDELIQVSTTSTTKLICTSSMQSQLRRRQTHSCKMVIYSYMYLHSGKEYSMYNVYIA